MGVNTDGRYELPGIQEFVASLKERSLDLALVGCCAGLQATAHPPRPTEGCSSTKNGEGAGHR